jgi:hypothetical protein
MNTPVPLNDVLGPAGSLELLSGGRVLAVRRDDVPGRKSAAAILRYPL